MAVRKQILSTNRLNSKNFRVIPDGVVWDRYKSNPVLLWNKMSGEHYGLSVGRVDPSSIVREGNKWVGNLIFDSTPEGLEAQKKWDEGSINAVSIFGPASIVERQGGRYAKRFEVWEISLVYVPADPGAVAVRNKEPKGLCAVEYIPRAEEIIVGLSAEDNLLIDKYESEMNENEEKGTVGLASLIEEMKQAFNNSLEGFLKRIGRTKKEAALAADEEPEEEPAALDSGEPEIEEPETEKQALSSEPEPEPEKEQEPEKENQSLAATETEPETKEEEPKDPEGLSAKEDNAKKEENEPETTGLTAGPDARIFEPQTKIKTKSMSTKPFGELVRGEEGKARLEAVQALSAYDPNEPGGIVRHESAKVDDFKMQSVAMLADSILKDPMALSAIENMTFQFGAPDNSPVVKVTETLQKLSSGYLANQYLENADLARIGFVNMFIRQLFPDDDWTTGIRRASVRDRQGFIWVESAINPAVYFGDRPPLNADNYTYDDNPMALARHDFAVQPVVWQPLNTDIIGYNDRATGMSEILAILSNQMHSYWLQRFAEAVPAAMYRPTTDTTNTINVANRLPINPLAAGTMYGPTVNDLISLQGVFINQNIISEADSITMVLTEPYFTGLRSQDEIKTILTRELSGDTVNGFNYSSYRIRSRSMIAGFDTATDSVVDMEKYFTFPIEDVTGAIDTAHTKPVGTATIWDIGLAFIPRELIIGIGNTHVHAVSDPNNYGWKTSICSATAAGTLRSAALGVALITPGHA